MLMALCATFAVGCSDDDGPETKGTPWTIKMTAKIEQARTIEFILDRENPVTIDWGDGSEVNALNWHHDYQPGTYDITLIGQGKIGLIDLNGVLTTIDVSQCPDLQKLYVYGYNITSLDVTACPELHYLACPGSDLTTLDVSQCPLLDTLTCSLNRLTELDITHNPKLVLLDCGGNQLTHLDISNCPSLWALAIEGNKMSTETLQSIVDALPDRSRLGSGLLILYQEEIDALDLSGLEAKNWNYQKSTLIPKE